MTSGKGDFDGKVVLVTGAAGGIGTALCREFNARGARVWPADLRPVERERFVAGDVADEAFAVSWTRQVLREEGRIDVLVNNAGICPRTGLFDIGADEWRRVMDVNLASVFFLGRLALKAMIEHKSGCIVNLASMAGKVGGIAVGAHYSASKAAIQCLTKTLARAGAPYNVRANAVTPGIIDTEITGGATPEQRQRFLETIPLARLGGAAEVARPVAFLASDAASYITGATLDINGGLLMD